MFSTIENLKRKTIYPDMGWLKMAIIDNQFSMQKKNDLGGLIENAVKPLDTNV